MNAPLVLTGVSNDFSLDDLQKPIFYLVFNQSLRVPVSQEAVQTVLAFAAKQVPVNGTNGTSHSIPTHGRPLSNEELIEQGAQTFGGDLDPEPTPSGFEVAGTDPTVYGLDTEYGGDADGEGVVDEDGIPQI